MNVPFGAVSSVVEHYNDTVGVTGSIPVLPTIPQRGILAEAGTAGQVLTKSIALASSVTNPVETETVVFHCQCIIERIIADWQIPIIGGYA